MRIFIIVICTCNVIILAFIFLYNWSIHANVVFGFRDIKSHSNVNVNGRDSHMVYELGDLLFRVYIVSNIFLRTNFFL